MDVVNEGVIRCDRHPLSVYRCPPVPVKRMSVCADHCMAGFKLKLPVTTRLFPGFAHKRGSARGATQSM